jgi:hypothetical protein
MAITNLNTVNKLPASQIPSGYTLPVVASFKDWTWRRTVTLSVLKATVETATPSTTMAAILANATIGVNKQVTDILAADFLATKTVTSFSELISLRLNTEKINVDDTTYLDNTAESYLCVVVIYVKSL